MKELLVFKSGNGEVLTKEDDGGGDLFLVQSLT